MRYEKKMLILSGEGKGVVLLEKSALGVKVAIRTFSVPATSGLKVGVIARTCVVIREMPSCKEPSLVFYIDDRALELDYLHIAVFDSAVRLYGAIGKRMWESNLMDLLAKADRQSSPSNSALSDIELAPPPPLKPLLPDPDGSGNARLRARYGDDMIAGDDYYTPFDMSARMKEVDGFLDTPRVLEDLPRIQKRETPVESVSQNDTAQIPQRAEELVEESAKATEQSELYSDADTEAADAVVEKFNDDRTDAEVSEAAATVDEQGGAELMPWERTAQYLNSLSVGELVLPRREVAACERNSTVKRVREATFFERCRADVDKLFSAAAKDGELNAILPDVEWVKVPFGGHVVSVGRGGDSFLCYAVPGIYEKVSPLGDEAQWLPKHKNAPTGKGYWLIFQDLKSGSIINAS